MKTQMIKLKDKFILVSDERVSSIQPKYYYCNKDHDWYKFSEDMMDDLKKEDRPILAGIPELPSIDFSLLNEEECLKIGFVDVEKLAKQHRMNICKATGSSSIQNEISFIEGFKTAQSLNDKMFSLEQMKRIYEKGYSAGRSELNSRESDKIKYDYIQSLQQTSWDVEVEMESELDAYYRNGVGGVSKPKIIKIL